MKPGEETADPLAHAARIERMLRGVRDHVAEDLERVDDGRARVLFETTLQVLDGLVTSFAEFQEASGLVRNGLPG